MLKKIIPFAIITLFFLLTAYFYRQNNVHIHFVDEEENIAVGYFINRGEKLYKDIFVQHQPLSYLISSAIQKVFSSDSIYEVIASHRDFVLVWSFLWSLLLVYFFGAKAIPVIMTVELIKIYFFGNLFLSESLVIYPVILLIFRLISPIKRTIFGSVIEGLSLGFIFLQLLPLWPSVIFYCVYLLLENNNGYKKEQTLIPFALVLLLVFLFLPISDYIQNTIFVNFAEYVPSGSELSGTNLFHSFVPFFNIFFDPSEHNEVLNFLKLLTIVYVASSVILYAKNKKTVLLSIIILGLLNIRYVGAGLTFYRGFHSLPWLCALITIVFINLYSINKSHKINNAVFPVFSALLVLLFSFYLTKSELFVFRNKDNDYYINYSRQFDLGEAVRILKSDGDSLQVVPDEFLIYWQAKIQNNNKYVFYYNWMDENERIRNDMNTLLSSSPPKFIYCRDCTQYSVSAILGSYTRLKKDGSPTDLYIQKDVTKIIDEKRKKELDFYNFEI